MEWHQLATNLAAGTAAGAAFWVTARFCTLLAARLPQKPPYAAELLAGAGDRDRLRYRALGRELGLLLAALLTALIVMSGAALLDVRILPASTSWSRALAGIISAALLALGFYRMASLVIARRRARFAWAARAAVGNILKRLNLFGNRVFHEVNVEGVSIDHVVVGTRGVFAINVVARPAPRHAEGRPMAELKNGKLRLADSVEAMPVGDAARNMTLLSGALSRIVGHRVPVRSVLAVPGWHSVPSDKSNHLVLNDRNLVMLTSWTKPDAHLMDEDCVSIQAFLEEASRVRRMD